MAKDERDDALWQRNEFFDPNGPDCLIIQATMGIAAGLDRFQPAGFPEVGHVIYDSPDSERQKVCIVDSAASMANHLEQVCLAGENDSDLHTELTGLPYVKCVTDRNPQINERIVTCQSNDPRDRLIATTLTEGHRVASDYFLNAKKLTRNGGNLIASSTSFRDDLRSDFNLIEVKKDKTYFIPSESWWDIYKTLFKYDPNSLVHGVLFAKEQIKISRVLTAHLEAFGAARVGSAGVKFDRLGKTTSGQPIFAVDQETAREIRATFIIDLGMLRSYGRELKQNDQEPNVLGLNRKQKELLLAFALWKIQKLVQRTFSYRSGCKLSLQTVNISSDAKPEISGLPLTLLPIVSIGAAISEAYEKNGDSALSSTGTSPPNRSTSVYYPYDELFKPGKDDSSTKTDEEDEAEEGDSESGD